MPWLIDKDGWAWDDDGNYVFLGEDDPYEGKTKVTHVRGLPTKPPPRKTLIERVADNLLKKVRIRS